MDLVGRMAGRLCLLGGGEGGGDGEEGMAEENLAGAKFGGDDLWRREREPRFFLKIVGKAGNTLWERRGRGESGVWGGGVGGGEGGNVGFGGTEDEDKEEDVGRGKGDGGEGRGRERVEVEEEGTGLGSMVFATQSIRGLTFSSQGIPRIMACAPIEETKKVCLWATPAIVYDKTTNELHDRVVLPSAKETFGPTQGTRGISNKATIDSWIRLIEEPPSTRAWSKRIYLSNLTER
jgi:hypothetical protein